MFSNSKRILTIGLVAALSACSFNDEPEVEVTLRTHPLSAYFSVIEIQSITDRTVIKDVIVNRGNCSLLREMKEDVELQYGAHFTTPSSCAINSIREVTVTTDNSTFTFQFD